MAVKTKTKAAKAAKTPRGGGKTAAKDEPKAVDAPRTVRLGQFREDPDNVSVATDEEIARLAGKLKRVPLGLTAMRIAYVTDAPGGGCMVVSGNKRLRCLKAAYGEDGEVPAEWFQDITAMSEAERHEFRLNANISDGHFDLDKLLAQYDTAELSEAGLDELLADLPSAGQDDGQTDADAPNTEEGEEVDEDDAEYQAFVDKFKPKKTTDDCYTPKLVYDAVLKWVVSDFKLEGREVVRPFWPGGDYQSFDYPKNCVVIDNPPFSILTQIVRWFNERKIDYFLFCPHLTNFAMIEANHISAPHTVTYENGAKVPTSFVTSLGEWFIRTAPDLLDLIRTADEENLKDKHKELPKFLYPDCVLTAAMTNKLAKYGQVLKIRREDCAFIRSLDEQGKDYTIFGGGFIISERAAAERAAAERAAAERAAAKVWNLSPRELEIQRHLGAVDA